MSDRPPPDYDQTGWAGTGKMRLWAISRGWGKNYTQLEELWKCKDGSMEWRPVQVGRAYELK